MNSFGNVFRPLSWLIAVSLAVVVAGCGGGGDGGPAPARPAADAAPIGNVGGVWTITETDITSPAPECKPPLNPLANYPVTITHTGNANAVTVSGDRTNSTTPTTFQGTIKGNKLTWSGNYPEQGGITTQSVDTTVASDCNGLSGTSNWSFAGTGTPAFTCTATTQFTGTRNTPVTSCAQSPS